MKKSIVSLVLCSFLSTVAIPAICLADISTVEVATKKKKAVKAVKVVKMAKPAKSAKKKAPRQEIDVVVVEEIAPAKDQFVFNKYVASHLENKMLKEVIIVSEIDIPHEKMRPHYEHHLNRIVGYKEIQEMCHKITDHVRSKGHILAHANPQKVKLVGGVLTIYVTEGGVNEVIMADKLSKNSLLAAYMDRIKAEQPLTKKTYENNMVLAKDLPGLHLYSYFKPSHESDHKNADLVLESEKYELESYWAFNNYGKKADGMYNADIGLDFNSIFGSNSKLATEVAFASKTPNLHGINSKYSLPFNSRGGKIHFGVSYNDVHNPQTTYFSSNINLFDSRSTGDLKGDSMQYLLGLNHPLYLSRAVSIQGEVDLVARNDQVVNVGTLKSIHRNFRIVHPGIVTKFSNKSGSSLSVAMHMHKGLNAFGAKKSGTGVEDINFTKYTMDIGAMQNFARNFNISVVAHGQTSGKVLVTEEEVGFGGRLIGRGFDTNTIAGDRGLGIGLELNYIKKLVADNIVKGFEPYLFVDAAGTRNILLAQTQKLLSGGGGLKAILAGGLMADLTYARQLKNTTVPSFKGRSRMMFNVAYNLNM